MEDIGFRDSMAAWSLLEKRVLAPGILAKTYGARLSNEPEHSAVCVKTLRERDSTIVSSVCYENVAYCQVRPTQLGASREDPSPRLGQQ